MIAILYVERNKNDVSSHVISSLLFFHVPCNLLCLNSLWTALVCLICSKRTGLNFEGLLKRN